uniref:Uncharacterized protein n=1 Tax=Caenorhabditis japonica TaxID=281687 RepID=A0A8R1J0K6_CAEJA
MRFWLILFVFCSSGLCFDFFLETLPKTVNWSSDPCEDFYRHVCPIGSVSDPLVKTVASHLDDQQAASKLTHLKFITNIFVRGRDGRGQKIGRLVEKRCEQGLDNQNLFDTLKNLSIRNGHCFGVFCEEYWKRLGGDFHAPTSASYPWERGS